MKDTITLKGDRELWIDFISVIKKKKKEVWEVLNPMIKNYIKNAKR